MAGLQVASVTQTGNGEEVVFSEDAVLMSEEYLLV